MRRERALASAVGACLVVLTACGGGPAMVVPATSTHTTAIEIPASPTAVPATPVPRQPGLGEILWSTEPLALATPVPAVTQLTGDAPRIIANVPAYALPPGSQVSATWSYNNTSLDDFATTLSVDQPRAEQQLTFQLSRNTEERWPPGVYEITISLNGQAVQSASIEIIP